MTKTEPSEWVDLGVCDLQCNETFKQAKPRNSQSTWTRALSDGLTKKVNRDATVFLRGNEKAWVGSLASGVNPCLVTSERRERYS